MKNILLVLLQFSFFGTLLLTAYTCSSVETTCGESVPEEILKKADGFIKVQTGDDYFENYISLNDEETRRVNEGYFMSYRLHMPENPYVEGKITFILDSTGVLSPGSEPAGIPPCAESPEECRFLVDQFEAERIAREAGLDKGIKEWGTTFGWNAEYKQYVWTIISTLKGTDTPDGFRGSGIEMLVDPNSGEVIRKSEWNIR